MSRIRRLGARALPALLAGLVLGWGSASAQVGKRVALVVGNGDYRQVGTMPGADRDAGLLADALVRLDFEVIRLANADLRTMRTALGTFERSAAGSEAALFFYSGHALRLRNQARLVPVDATLQDLQGLERETLPLTPLVDAMSQASSAFLLADGCVDAGLAKRLQWIAGASPGPGDPPSRGGLLSAFATAQEQTCEDRLFVESLLADLEEPGVEATDLMQRAQQRVARRSGGAQQVTLAVRLARSFSFADEKVARTAFRRLGVDPKTDRMRRYVDKHPADGLTPVVKALLTQRETLETRSGATGTVRAWGSLMDDGWNNRRAERARASRNEALEARWSRESDATLPDRKAMRLAALVPQPPLASRAPTPAPAREAPSPAPKVPPPVVTPAPEAKKPPPEPAPLRKLEEAIGAVPEGPPPPSFPAPPPAPPPAEPKVATLAAPSLVPEDAKPQLGEKAEPPAEKPPAAEEKPPEPPPENTASLAPPAPTPAEPSPPPFDSESPDVLKAMQQELKRLGCYAGEVDGKVGPQTNHAVDVAAAKLGMRLQPLTSSGLQALRDHKGILCPSMAEPVVPPPRPAPPPRSAPPVATREVPPPQPPPVPATAPAPAPAAAPQPAPSPPPAATVTPAPEPARPSHKFKGITM